MSTHIHRHDFSISRAAREEKQGHRGHVFFLTGLSGAGKSTVADGVEQALFEKGTQILVLDADTVRSGLNKDLKFSEADRKENIRRVSEVAKIHCERGGIVIIAAIAPKREERALAKEIIGAEDFSEIHISCPLEECETRDVKGLYKKRREGIITNFIGIDTPYEPPVDPDLLLDTTQDSIEANVQKMQEYLEAKVSL